MAEITRVPLGLQKALGLQTQGDNPSDFGQQISPGIDMSRYYDIYQTYWYNVGTASAVDVLQDIVVPASEVWIARTIGIAVRGTGTTAGDNANFAVYAFNVQQSNAGQQFHPIANFGNFAAPIGGGTALYSARVYDLNGMILFGGTTLRFAQNDTVVTTGTINWRGAIQYLRIQI